MYACPAFADLEAFSKAQDRSLIWWSGVPPALQPSLVEQLLARCSPRMLLLEKPVAINVEAAQRLRQVGNRHLKLVVGVNYIRRYYLVVLELQSQLKASYWRVAARAPGLWQGVVEQRVSFCKFSRSMAWALVRKDYFGHWACLC